MSEGQGELILYRTEDGRAEVQLRADGDTAWLSQADMAALFETTKQNISLHIRKLLAEGELPEDSVVKFYLTTAADGKRYKTMLYRLDLILAVGFRVRSPRGTQFRRWGRWKPSSANAAPRSMPVAAPTKPWPSTVKRTTTLNNCSPRPSVSSLANTRTNPEP
jgi:hypothetical protein